MRAAVWLSFHNIRPDLWGRCMHADIADVRVLYISAHLHTFQG